MESWSSTRWIALALALVIALLLAWVVLNGPL